MKRLLEASALFMLGSLATLASVRAGESTAADEGRDASIVVAVHDPAGRAVNGEIYVALVAISDGPARWGEPFEERLTAEGTASVTFRVRAGRYQTLCSATSYALAVSEEVEVASGDVAELVCRVTDLAARRVRIVSQTGSPLSAVQVVPAHLAVLGASGGASPLAKRHLRSFLIATSDETGMATVRGPEGTQVSVVLSREGFADRLVHGLRFQSEETKMTVSLEPGADLRVRGNLVEMGTGTLYLDQLWGKQAQPGLERLWRRSVQSPQAIDVIWPRLPAGGYDVLYDSDRSDTAALVAHNVEVRAGGNHDVWIDSDRVVTARSITVVPSSRLEAAPDLEARLGLSRLVVYLSSGVDWRRLEAPRYRRDQNRLHFPPESCQGRNRQLVAFSATGVAGPQRLSEICSEPNGVRLVLQPAATVSGAVTLPGASSSVPIGTLETLRCIRSAVGDKSRFPVEFSPSEIPDRWRWRSQVPAGCRELKLWVPGYAPLSWKDLALSAGGDVVLGHAEAELASSLSGLVVANQDGRPVPSARVVLVSSEDAQEVLAALLTQRDLPSLAETMTDEDGSFLMTGLPAGSYVLAASAAGPGVPLVMPSFRIGAGMHQDLAELLLPEPARIHLEVQLDDTLKQFLADQSTEGAILELFAFTKVEGCAWLLGASAQLELPSAAHLFSNLMPGTWLLTAKVRGPAGSRFDLGEVAVTLASGDSTPATIQAEGEFFAGIVSLGGEPWTGQLAFERGKTRIDVMAEDNGQFEAFLLQRGAYQVSATSDSANFFVPAVSFTDPARRVEIELPGGVIAGIVVDQQGRSFPGARVTAIKEFQAHPEQGGVVPSPVSRSQAESDGRFRLKNLNPGLWTLRAEAEGVLGDALEVLLHGSADSQEDVMLVLGEPVRLSGRLMRQNMPVGGASLIAYSMSAPRLTSMGFGQATTQHDGSFALSLPSRTSGAVTLLVQAPGESIGAFVVAAPGYHELRMPPTAADVWLQSSGAELEDLLLVHESGAFLGSRIYPDIETSSRGSRFRGLREGEWKVVPIDRLLAADNWERLQLGDFGALPAMLTFRVDDNEPIFLQLSPDL